MIEHYSFGRLVISGREYRSDLMIFPDGSIQDSWWRQQGHRLVIADIINLVQADPEIIIIGSGANGLMKTADELKTKLANTGIEIIETLTSDAVKVYNEIFSRKKTGACFHLTCQIDDFLRENLRYVVSDSYKIHPVSSLYGPSDLNLYILFLLMLLFLTQKRADL